MADVGISLESKAFNNVRYRENGDGTVSQVVYVDGLTFSGPVSISGEVEVKNDAGNAVSISASSLPLPGGAATASNQTTGNTSLASIDTKLSSQATATNQATANISLASIDTKLTGNATAVNQTTGNSSLSSIDGKLTGVATATNQTTANASLNNLDTNLGAKADSSATSDTGTFSLIALVKRLLTKLAFVFDSTSGGLKVQEQYIPGYEDNTKNRALVQNPGIPATITTATTTTVVTGAYHINSIRVIGGTLGNVTVYDNTSATGTPIIPAITPDKGQVLLTDVDVNTGLTIVTAAATIILVSYSV